MGWHRSATYWTTFDLGYSCPRVDLLAGQPGHAEGSHYLVHENEQLMQRLIAFAKRTYFLCRVLLRDHLARHIADQLFRSASSSGANYAEARVAASARDRIHKMRISLKELNETTYWLQLIGETELIHSDRISDLQDECQQLSKIFNSSIHNRRKREITSDL